MVGVEALERIDLVVVDEKSGIIRALNLSLPTLRGRVSAHSFPMAVLDNLPHGARPDAILSDPRANVYDDWARIPSTPSSPRDKRKSCPSTACWNLGDSRKNRYLRKTFCASS